MAALAIETVTEETEKGIVDVRSNTESKTLVALSSDNVEASITKFASNDSGILCKNDSEISSLSSVPSVVVDVGESNHSQDKKITENTCSQKSTTSNWSLKSSQTSSKANYSSPSKLADEDSNSSFSSILNRSQSVNQEDNDNSCSYIQSSSTVNARQCSAHKSDDESNHASSSRCSSRQSSPQKHSQNTTSLKSIQSVPSDCTRDSNSISSIRSASKSPMKTSQSVSYKSDDDTSRSSFRSSKKSTPQKHSQTSVNTEVTEDNDSRSSTNSSSSTSTIKNSQSVTNKQDDENSRSSIISASNKNTPEKTSDKSNNKKKRFASIIDSDSEDDNTTSGNLEVNNESSQSQPEVNNSKKKHNRLLIDSDTDDEIIAVNRKDSSTEKKDSKVTKKSNKISCIVDSESESDRESLSGSGNEKENSKTVQKRNKLSLLIDSDSESDRDEKLEHEHQNGSDNENDAEKPSKGKKKSDKKRTGSARASKDMAMQQIRSETQRLIRESQLSLPYHRPKQRTLEEFLNRKKTSTNLPKNITNAERIKMFPELISKVVKEKEEEAENFYKSSDSEEEEESDKTMEVDKLDKDDKIENNTEDSDNLDSIQIFCTQKMTQDDIQESHNKKELLLQRTVDFGATRKLFSDDVTSTDQTAKTPAAERNMQSEAIENTENIHKESSTENKDSSFPTKSFTENEDKMDVDEEMNNQDASTSENKNDKEKENSHEKLTVLENNTEDIVLNMSETEHESKEIQDKDKEFDKESTLISDTSLISQKYNLKENENDENTKDPILKLSDDVKDDDEILDPKMLESDYFRAPDADEPEPVKPLTIKEKIFANASKLKPMIKSSPGCVIDLSNSGPIKDGASKLLDRFLSRHIPTHKSTVENVTEVKILRTEGFGNDVTVVEEILPFKKSAVEDIRERKPGERYQLKKELMLQIASARDEEWKNKEVDENEEEEEESKCRGDDFYEGLPDEEELLEDEDSGESEPEENDVPLVDKKKRKCEFGDEEAEESEVDGEEANEAAEEDENEEEEEQESDEEDEEESESEKEEVSQKPKKLRRIISAFEDDDSNQSELSVKSDEANKKARLGRAKTDEDMFSSQVSNDAAAVDIDVESIPPFQFRERADSDPRSEACKTPLPKANNILSMISPVAQLTALNTSLESAKKSASKTNNFELGQISSQNTPTENGDRIQSNCNIDKMVGLQKKLFEDPPDGVNEDELLAICSGRFTQTQSSGVPAMSTENGVTESQLMAICSGAFETPAPEAKRTDEAVLVADETSQDITLAIDDDEEPKSSPSKRSTSMKPSDESMFSSDSSKMSKSSSTSSNKSTLKNPMDLWLKKTSAKPTQAETQIKENDVTESQLMGLCSGAFTSQAIDMKKLEENTESLNHDEVSQDFQLTLDDNSNSSFKETVANPKDQGKSSVDKKVEEGQSNPPAKGLRIASSSEDEGSNKAKKEKPKKKVLRKKKVAKLQLSDDEDDEPKEFSDNEESEVEEDNEEKFIDYDSEENEVVVVPKKEIKKVAKKFLENEAELSESDWDSADEDERGLDKFEAEEADAEDIDEEKMKNELDRIHMKQVMDEDQREVRMLQELLFDDGDLHSEGAGRERKFKWKNIDNMGPEDLGPTNEDDPEALDDEVDAAVELQMRKMRYEQLKFQEETEQNITKAFDDDFGESALSKSGLKVVSVRSNKTLAENKMNKANTIDDPSRMVSKPKIIITKKSASTSFSRSNMRGSFLARGEETLVRIAQNLPEKSSVSMSSMRKGKFVFEHLSPSVSNAPKDDSEQENDNTPAKDTKGNARKRKIFSSQTPRSTKKMKVDDRASGKKLF